MDDRDKEDLIGRYIAAYNSFDIEGMLALMHPECSFQNVSGGRTNASAMGVAQIRELAEKSRALFSLRRQVIRTYRHDADSITVGIDYEGVLRVDIPDGPRAGDTVKLRGESVFRFRDGLISQLVDYS